MVQSSRVACGGSWHGRCVIFVIFIPNPTANRHEDDMIYSQSVLTGDDMPVPVPVPDPGCA